ncbi:MAG: cyclic pyranopterin monophosphate synthase MoaC [Planctomycetes bacterium]|nr:cyclic pyranopterin monophosphate synthase MoaC [Planctomycetota bacterium]
MSDTTESDQSAGSNEELTHLDAHGRAHMVDVGAKAVTERVAEARGRVVLDASIRERLFAGELPKGEGLAVARIAGIQAAKETPRLIPLCHSVALTSVEVAFSRAGEDAVEVRAVARCRDRTGVEMEALTAVSVAALTIYDMCKAVCRGASIERIELVGKSGGRSGVWRRKD